MITCLFAGDEMTDRKTGEGDRLEQALETIDTNKRETMRKLLTSAAFAVPVVVSFSIDGMTLGAAHASHGNGSHS